MGNCLVLEGKVIKVVRTDGKVLEYKAPIKAHQILGEFSGHAISDSLPDSRHLQPDAKLVGGQLYHLVPLPSPSPSAKKKKVRFANPEVEDKQGVPEEVNVVRVKLVITKQELQQLLQGGSIEGMVSRALHKQISHATDVSDVGADCKGWKPGLESIPEID